MLTSIKLRIYPNQLQQEKLANSFGCARWVWNNSLAACLQTYDDTGKCLRQFELNNRLPQLKKEFSWLSRASAQSLQAVCLNLTQAFDNFAKKRAGYPNFKSKHSKQSIRFPQHGRIVNEREIYVPKIGYIQMRGYRFIEGTVKHITISKTSSDKYYAAVLIDTHKELPHISFDGKILGIDVGLNHLLTTSDGLKIENPRQLKKAQKNLKRKQQSVSRKKLGSNSRKKAQKLVARTHEKIANSRKDLLHKLSHMLINENQVIAVEKLNIRGMLKNHCLSKAISDAGWFTFKNMLQYKAHREGKGYLEVGRFFPSSKMCSSCGYVVDVLPLNVREWVCPICDNLHDRDINASINIRVEAERMIATGVVATAD